MPSTQAAHDDASGKPSARSDAHPMGKTTSVVRTIAAKAARNETTPLSQKRTASGVAIAQTRARGIECALAAARTGGLAPLPVGDPSELYIVSRVVPMHDQLVAEGLQPGVQAGVIPRPPAAERLGHRSLPAEQARAALLDAIEQRRSTALPLEVRGVARRAAKRA